MDRGGGIPIIGRLLGGREDDEKDEQEPGDEAKPEEVEEPKEPEAPKEPEQPSAGSNATKLNGATFEELRELGFSVTQATRVITYRERQDGFESIDDLDRGPRHAPHLPDARSGTS